MGTVLHQRWPDRDPASLAYAVRHLVPLVQVPPRGLWGRSGAAWCATAETWLGRPLQARPSLEKLILRYLAAFGPASVGDIQAWSGLRTLRPIVDRLRPQLRSLTDAGGRELLDVPDGVLPDPDTPAPPRFLPEYDNLLLAHADRTRVVPKEYWGRHWVGNVAHRTFLVDGFLAGVWKPERDSLVIEPFGRLTGAQALGAALTGQVTVGGRDVACSATWRLADLGSKHMLLKEGIGWGNMPMPMVQEDLDSGRLVHLDLPDTKGGIYSLEAIYRADTPPGPAAAWLIARFKSQVPNATITAKPNRKPSKKSGKPKKKGGRARS